MNKTPVVSFKTISINGYSGIKYYSRNLIRALAGLDIQLKLFTTFKQKGMVEELLGNMPNIDVQNRLPHPRALGRQLEFITSPWSDRKLISLARESSDMLHWLNPEFFHPSLSESAVTVHDMFPFYEDEWAHRAFGAGQAREQEMNRRIIETAGMIFVPSRETFNDVIKYVAGVNPDKIIVAPLAAGEAFRPVEPSPQVLGGYGLEKGEYFLFVSQLNPRKNLEGVLEAFSMLPPALKQKKKLAIVGGGSQARTEAAKSRISSLGLGSSVVMLKSVPDENLRHLYSGAICLVFVSFAEGFGLPVIEAMNCGCPVITSNVSSMAEVAENAALAVSPRDSREISMAMARLANDVSFRYVLSESGISHSRDFSWEKTALLHYRGYVKFIERNK